VRIPKSEGCTLVDKAAPVALLYGKLQNMLPPKCSKKIRPPFAIAPLLTKDANAARPGGSLDRGLHGLHSYVDHRSITASTTVNGMNDEGAICDIKITHSDLTLDSQRAGPIGRRLYPQGPAGYLPNPVEPPIKKADQAGISVVMICKP
jgi:hypothetical protein